MLQRIFLDVTVVVDVGGFDGLVSQVMRMVLELDQQGLEEISRVIVLMVE